jgi:hypothetical protein
MGWSVKKVSKTLNKSSQAYVQGLSCMAAHAFLCLQTRARVRLRMDSCLGELLRNENSQGTCFFSD